MTNLRQTRLAVISSPTTLMAAFHSQIITKIRILLSMRNAASDSSVCLTAVLFGFRKMAHPINHQTRLSQYVFAR